IKTNAEELRVKGVDLVNRKNIVLQDETETINQEDLAHNTVEVLEKTIRENNNILNKIVSNKKINLLKPDIKKLVNNKQLVNHLKSKQTVLEKTDIDKVSTEIQKQNLNLQYLYNEDINQENIINKLSDSLIKKTQSSKLFNLVETDNVTDRNINVKRDLKFLTRKNIENIDTVTQNRILNITKGLVNNTTNAVSADLSNIRMVNLENQTETEQVPEDRLVYQDGVSQNSRSDRRIVSTNMVYREPVVQKIAEPEEDVKKQEKEEQEVAAQKEQARQKEQEEKRQREELEKKILTEDQINMMIETRANQIAETYFRSINIEKISKEIVQNVEKTLERQRRRFGL
ncbi:MAG: hypothetical protein Q4B14_04330, partial [Clostridia bacterium]|nr:hypothetical protein [Clostridia bacterium]